MEAPRQQTSAVPSYPCVPLSVWQTHAAGRAGCGPSQPEWLLAGSLGGTGAVAGGWEPGAVLTAASVCSYRNLATEHEALMQKYLHLLQIVETEKTVAKQLRQQIEDGEIEIERLKAEVWSLASLRWVPRLRGLRAAVWARRRWHLRQLRPWACAHLGHVFTLVLVIPSLILMQRGVRVSRARSCFQNLGFLLHEWLRLLGQGNVRSIREGWGRGRRVLVLGTGERWGLLAVTLCLL